MAYPESFYSHVQVNSKQVILSREFCFESHQDLNKTDLVLHHSPNASFLQRPIEGLSYLFTWVHRTHWTSTDPGELYHMVELLPELRSMMSPLAKTYAGVLILQSYALIFIQRAEDLLYLKVMEVRSPNDLLYQLVNALQCCSLSVNNTPILLTGEVQIESALVIQLNRYFYSVQCLVGFTTNH